MNNLNTNIIFDNKSKKNKISIKKDFREIKYLFNKPFNIFKNDLHIFRNSWDFAYSYAVCKS